MSGDEDQKPLRRPCDDFPPSVPNVMTKKDFETAAEAKLAERKHEAHLDVVERAQIEAEAENEKRGN